MASIGKSLIILGIVLATAGAAIWIFGAIPGAGRLPGDIYVRRGNFTFYFPIVTCLLLSVVATVVLSLLRR